MKVWCKDAQSLRQAVVFHTDHLRQRSQDSLNLFDTVWPSKAMDLCFPASHAPLAKSSQSSNLHASGSNGEKPWKERERLFSSMLEPAGDTSGLKAWLLASFSSLSAWMEGFLAWWLAPFGMKGNVKVSGLT